MTEMTSRERALTALNHQEPDRVPIDIGGLTSFTCWHEEADRAVKESLGYEVGEQEINSFFSRTVRPDQAIRDRFKTDFFGFVSKSGSQWQFDEHKDEEGGKWVYDEWGIKWRRPSGGYYYDAVKFPLAGATLRDVTNYKWPDPADPARLTGVVQVAREMYENSDYCLCHTPVWATGIFQVSGLLQGWEDHYVNVIADKKVSQAVFDGLTEFHIAQCGAILDTMGDTIQVLQMSDDLGFQDRPMIRTELFREMIKPCYVRIIDSIKTKKPDIKLVFHSDGAIYPFLSEFIDIGLDAINPVQVSCKGMDDTAKLKQEFGERLTFWGAGVDTQSTLPNGTAEEVRAEVGRRISDLAPGGGYIFATVHNVQYDVPVKNIIACYDAAFKYGNYPIKNNKTIYDGEK